MHRRLGAQIEGLNWAAEQIASVAGDALELGLGNGRTYDHLRQVLPDRRIWVIERQVAPHPDSMPPKEDILLGEALDMLPQMARDGVRLALAHYDLGSGIKQMDVAEAAELSALIAAVMQPGGLVVSQQPLPGFEQITGPDTVHPERYLFYRA